ncbi:aminotransferase class III-fold pyridoxal phosphate-dependent enzyme [Candidatus Methylopumilus universalis]|uniref:aspartate aminotransferase family protein n=1 Tax=Candidatus Methylopumilus universalis TaxID=2588536 RepID=UPI001124600E|nr:aminotransferase class III-fold pyridoxal phosphate-dependent enzyme [Candidatus Methylopumilus universalis]QDC89820.1 aminotransferase class III-fold pyridoxal phosphate-dependent enzyme [Candidatus Methylopumilus universalis]
MDQKIIEILDKNEKYCSHGDTVNYADPPKVFENCDGSFLFDEKGIPYLDWQMWYSAVNFGYKNKRIADTLKKQIDTLPQLASQYLHKEKVDLAEIICKYMEDKYGVKGRVHFNVGGAQAIEDSLKVVRNHTGKTHQFAFMGGYHGRTLGASAITSSYRYRRRFGNFADRAQFIPYPYCFRCPYSMKVETCDTYCHKEFEKLFDTEYQSVWDEKAGQCEFGAFYIEPMQGTGGYIVPPKGYMKKIAESFKKSKVLLVADEIQMGVYRTGKLWSWENFDIIPDIFVFGKAITNGLNPLSGIWAKEELINPQKFPPGSTHSTFASNPLGTSVALEVMKMTEEDDFGKKVNDRGAYFLKRIQELKSRWKVVGDVSGLGLALRIELCENDGFKASRKLADRMFNEGLKGDIKIGDKTYGLVLDIGGYEKNVITLAPSLLISEEEIDLGIQLFEALLKRCGAE